MKRLLIRADDLGYSEGINCGIAAAVAAEVERAMVAGFLAIFPDGCTRGLVEAHSGPNWAAAKG